MPSTNCGESVIQEGLLQAKLAWFEKDQSLIRQFRTGVSIHSHTSRSKESLEFVDHILQSNSLLRRFIQSHDEKSRRHFGLAIDLKRGYWTPPLSARSSYEVEKSQIEQKLNMRALVSLTDHDCIDAPMLLRVVPAMQESPVSLEWTVPFQSCKFHIGVHNLPGARAQQWMDELAACTAEPSTERVCDLLRSLHAIPDVLVVFNHPLWNLYNNPPAEFTQNLEDFLALNNGNLHAFELNGMRRWEENCEVAKMAARWQQIMVSGGDRHGTEPNANLNLTTATSFSEWVHEVRVERKSQLLFMPQYNHSMVARFYQTFLDAISERPDNSDGACRWDQRTYHPGRDGEVHPISELWRHVPGFLRIILGIARLAETTHLLKTLRVYGGEPVGHLPGIAGQEKSA